MAVPTKKQLEKWAEAYVRTWNEGDREAWCQNYRDVAPGEYTMWDPVGTPPKRGFEEIVAAYDLFQPTVKFEVPRDTLFYNEGYVAWVMHNIIEHNGGSMVGKSIESYEFGGDGSLNIRTHCVVPAHDDKALGDLYKVYLPDEAQGSR
ncbi:MAG: hypothetical protein AAEJ53_04500 [Myxococcota bacterium]